MAGSILNSRAHSTRTSATDVRELVSITIDRTSGIGRVVKSATDATGPRDAMARSGTIRYESPRRYSIDGNQPEVDLARVKQPRAFGRQVEAESRTAASDRVRRPADGR